MREANEELRRQKRWRRQKRIWRRLILEGQFSFYRRLHRHRVVHAT